MAVFEGLYLSTGDHLSIPFEWTPLGRHHFLYAGGNKVIHYLQQGVIEEDIWTFFRRRPEGSKGLLRIPHQKRKYDGQESVRRARSRVGEKRYNILTNNCEHFCNWCIDGVSGTGQVTNATAQATAPVLGSAAAGAGMAAAGAGAFTAATGGAGMMSTLATVGSAVGGGAMAGIGVIGGAGGGLATIIANNTIFSDKPEDDASEKRRKDAGRVGTTIGAAAGTAGALTMVVTSAAAGTAGGAAITSGLAGIGAILGGGMVAGAATVVAAPAVIALGIGSLFYAIFD